MHFILLGRPEISLFFRVGKNYNNSFFYLVYTGDSWDFSSVYSFSDFSSLNLNVPNTEQERVYLFVS